MKFRCYLKAAIFDYLYLALTWPQEFPRINIWAMGFPGGTSGKEPTWKCQRHKRRVFDPWVGKIPWRRAWQPTPVFLPGKSHGQRVFTESDTLQRLNTHTSGPCFFYVSITKHLHLELLLPSSPLNVLLCYFLSKTA